MLALHMTRQECGHEELGRVWGTRCSSSYRHLLPLGLVAGLLAGRSHDEVDDGGCSNVLPTASARCGLSSDAVRIGRPGGKRGIWRESTSFNSTSRERTLRAHHRGSKATCHKSTDGARALRTSVPAACCWLVGCGKLRRRARV